LFHLGEKRRINPFTPVPKSITGFLGLGRGNGDCTVKKVSDFSSQESVTKLFLAGNKLILVSDIPAGDGKIANLFYSALAPHPFLPQCPLESPRIKDHEFTIRLLLSFLYGLFGFNNSQGLSKRFPHH
jgi:hypothetical protein